MDRSHAMECLGIRDAHPGQRVGPTGPVAEQRGPGIVACDAESDRDADDCQQGFHHRFLGALPFPHSEPGEEPSADQADPPRPEKTDQRDSPTRRKAEIRGAKLVEFIRVKYSGEIV